MSIRFNVRRRTILPTQGRILIRPFIPEDWGSADITAARYDNFGSINVPPTETEDWGHLPSASV